MERNIRKAMRKLGAKLLIFTLLFGVVSQDIAYALWDSKDRTYVYAATSSEAEEKQEMDLASDSEADRDEENDLEDEEILDEDLLYEDMKNADLCSEALCPHLYWSLDNKLKAACKYGQKLLKRTRRAENIRMLVDYQTPSEAEEADEAEETEEEDFSATISEASYRRNRSSVRNDEREIEGRQETGIEGKGIFFSSVENAMLDDYDQEHIKYVIAVFYKEYDPENPETEENSDNTLRFRMYEADDGIYSTVIPEDTKYITFQIVYLNDDIQDTEIVYKFDDPDNEDGELLNLELGYGEFQLKQKTMDCYYYNGQTYNSYWSAHRSADDKVLNGYAVYLDNRLDSEVDAEDSTDNQVFEENDELILTYLADVDDGQEVKTIIKKPVRKSNGFYFQFPNDGSTRESTIFTLHAVLAETGEEYSFSFLYTIDSGLNMLVARNLIEPNEENLGMVVHNPWGIYESTGDRYVAFRMQTNQLNRKDGGGSQNLTIPKEGEYEVQYRATGSEALQGDRIQWPDTWTKMEKFDPENSGSIIDELFKDILENVWFSLQLSVDDAKYIQFRVVKKGTDVTTQLKAQDQELYFYTPEQTIEEFTGEEDDKGRPDLSVLEIDDSYVYPCYCPDIFQKSVYKSSKPEFIDEYKLVTGSWSSIMKPSSKGDRSRNIPEGTLKLHSNTYYATVDFYDYYSDWEMRGIRQTDIEPGKYTNGNDYNRLPYIFCEALSSYYKEFYDTTDEMNQESFKPIYFGGDGASMAGFFGGNNDWNRFTTNDKLSQNIMAEDLSDTGELLFRNTGGKEIKVPCFDDGFIRGNNSLFSAVGSVYGNVSFPFILNSDGYWEFDSGKANQTVRLKEDPSEGYYLEQVYYDEAEGKLKSEDEIEKTPTKADEQQEKWVGGNGSGSGYGKIPGFFPFNDRPDGFPANGKKYADLSTLNSSVGMKMEIPFTLTSTGQVMMENTSFNPTDPDSEQFTSKDIIFDFTGDDDVWIYVDGKLALDLGGIHGTLKGQINFHDGTVQWGVGSEDGYRGYEQNFYGKLFGLNLPKDPNNFTPVQQQALKNAIEEFSQSQHTLSVFYFERGMYDSNLKMTFNFPSDNRLSVTNTIDTSAANQFFQEALEYIGNMSYQLNVQTTMGVPLAVEKSAGYLEAGKIATVSEFELQSQLNGTDKVDFTALQGGDQTEDLVFDSDHTSVGRIMLKENAQPPQSGTQDLGYVVKINIEGLPDLEQYHYDYFRMDLYSTYSQHDQNGHSLYLGMEDEQGNIVGNWIDQLTYSGYSNSIPSHSWTKVRVDLNKMLEGNQQFDRDTVKNILLGYRYMSQEDEQGNIKKNALYIDSLEVLEKPNDIVGVGFNINPKQISDFGSLEDTNIDEPGIDYYNNAKMVHADGAWYSLYETEKSDPDRFDTAVDTLPSKPAQVDSNGNFGLPDGGMAVFENKFRPGTYINLTERYTEESNLFNVTWTLLENGIPVPEGYLAPRANVNAVENQAVDLSVQNVRGVTPEDKRVVKKDGGLINPNTEQDKNNGTFVFLRYDDPDDYGNRGADLRVDYTHTIRVGNIVIKKKMETPNKTDKTYDFHIHFKNIGGYNLESNLEMTGSVDKDTDGMIANLSVTVPAGKTEGETQAEFQGIPVGTEYYVHEVVQKEENPPVNIYIGSPSGNDSDFYHDQVELKEELIQNQPTGGQMEMYTVHGTVNTETQDFTFVNQGEQTDPKPDPDPDPTPDPDPDPTPDPDPKPDPDPDPTPDPDPKPEQPATPSTPSGNGGNGGGGGGNGGGNTPSDHSVPGNPAEVTPPQLPLSPGEPPVPKIGSLPKTGDNTNIDFWGIAALGSVTLILCLLLIPARFNPRKKKKNS